MGISIMEKPPIKKDVYNLLRNKSTNYDEFALQLDVDDNFRDGLRKQNETNEWKLEQMLRRWIEAETCAVTWAKVLEVLVDLKMMQVAKEVKTFLKRPDIIQKYMKM